MNIRYIIAFCRKLAVASQGLLLSVFASANPYTEYKNQPTSENAFKYLHSVATHARCANCHGVVENGVQRPTIGDARQNHPMNISSANNMRFTVKDGRFINTGSSLPVNCSSCHQSKNGEKFGMPPGAANDLMPGFVWHMPPPTMVIDKGITPRDLCHNWLDPKKNSFLAYRGGREDMKTFKKEFEHHVNDDPLVRWAWAPGIGRTPAPGTHQDFARAMSVWIDGGAPCPNE